MPSAQQKKRAEKKKQAEKERMAKKNNKKVEDTPEGDAEVDKLAEEVEEVDLASLNARGTAGVLASHALSADIHIHNFSMTFHGKVCPQKSPSIPFCFYLATDSRHIVGIKQR